MDITAELLTDKNQWDDYAASPPDFFNRVSDAVIADLIEQEDLASCTSSNEKNALFWCTRLAKYGQFGYVSAGIWLQRLRQWKHLWGRKSKSFNDFCRETLGKGHWYAGRIIKASKVCLALIHRGFKTLPTNEAQARPLTKYLFENTTLNGDTCQEELFEKWQQVIDTAPSQQGITASHITAIVEGEDFTIKTIKADAKTCERLSRKALEAGMSTQEYLNFLLDQTEEPEVEPPEETEEPEETEKTEEVEPAKTEIWWDDVEKLLADHDEEIVKESTS